MKDFPTRKMKKYLLSLPQVVGVGYGFKVTGGVVTDKPAIVTLVSKKLSIEELSKDAIVPQTLDGIITDVVEVGEIQAFGATDLMRPAQPGVSIGHNKITAGTFGAIVYQQKGKQPMILSNNHVLANSTSGWDWRARIKDTILQPGPMDIEQNLDINKNLDQVKSEYEIARLSKYVPLRNKPLVNQVDAAIAKPLSNDLINPKIIGIGLVQGVTEPVVGMEVQKSGRTTGHTFGEIRITNAMVEVSYEGGRVLRFDKQVIATSMSSPGDSGSLVLDLDNQAVGLLFAGSESITVISPITTVLKLLNVTF